MATMRKPIFFIAQVPRVAIGEWRLTWKRTARTHHRARAGGNYDWADHTENGRIRLCIDAGSWRAVNERGTAARDTGVSRTAVPKVPGSWREEIGSPLRIIRLLPF